MAESLKNEFTHRLCLPSAMGARSDSNIWSLLKNCLGKDLCKVTMPVTLNEPLSFLQRICEYMEYANLLTEASLQEDPADRMKFVAGFAVSSLASNWERIGKPFNPLLGETYELQRNDYKIVCEQVSHHPPISAFHAESPDYKFYGTICPKIKFLGKTIEIQPKGTVTVELLSSWQIIVNKNSELFEEVLTLLIPIATYKEWKRYYSFFSEILTKGVYVYDSILAQPPLTRDFAHVDFDIN